MINDVINFTDKFKMFNDKWAPKIIAQMNDYHIKLARFEGSFTWHDHKETDEVFIVIEGSVRIDFEESSTTLNEGELFIVSKGIRHKPYAEKECKILLIEPAGTKNTGESGGEQTSPNDI